MKRIFTSMAVLAALVSCQSLIDEFSPLAPGGYDNPAGMVTYTEQDLLDKGWTKTTIADLAKAYVPEKPYLVTDRLFISGVVSTTDKPGNFYKSLYIQDEIGCGMEIKIGKNSLYNDYKPGQRIFVYLQDLTVGMYGYKTGNYGGMGMVQVGFSDPSGEYETSYLESALIVDKHILRGEFVGEVEPYVVSSASELPNPQSSTQATNSLVGRLVTIRGLAYDNQTFVLLYLDSTRDKKSYTNRVFLSDSNGSDITHGITTWAMSKSKMTEYLYAGLWDECKVGSGSTFTGQTLGDLKGDGTYPEVEKAAYSVSQYFKKGSVEFQIRTSGFCKFCDKEIPEEVLNGTKTLDVTGILTLYQGSIQITVNDISDFAVDGKPLR